MDSNRVSNLSLTPTVARQTQKEEFGTVLKDTLQKGAGLVSGALVGALPNVPVVSAAVSSVTALVSGGGGGTASASRAASGVATVAGSTVGVGSSDPALGGAGAQPNYDNMNGMMQQMRAEADRSLLMQMNMQQESREYNAVSNVLKTRHDSAKAAINNIR